ncbi:MAG: LysE family translocator [Vicinamibacterales bacterium]
MVFDTRLVAYLTYTFLLVITPGSTTAVVIQHTLATGPRGGFSAALGAALGNTTHATAAGLGLAVVLARWPATLGVVKVVGGLYLAWLGTASLWRAFRTAQRDERPASPAMSRGSFRQGLTVNLLNPSIATFYLVVVPSFVPADAPRWHFALLASMQIVMAFASHGMWALAFDRVRHVFDRPAARQALQAATAVALVALAARVVFAGP